MKTSLISIAALLTVSCSGVGAVRGLHTRKVGRNLQKESFSQEACAKGVEEAGEEYECACQGLMDTNDTALICVSNCEYCADNETVCGSEGFEDVYSVDGGVVAKEYLWSYSRGRDEIIAITSSDCTLDEEDNDNCDTCAVTVNDQPCASCTMENCTEGETTLKLPVFDCTNIDGGVTFNFCGADNTTVTPTELFGFLTTEETAYEECFEKTMMPSVSPSQFPTTAPSVLPSDQPSLSPSDTPTSSPPTLSPAPIAALTPAPTTAPVAVSIPVQPTDAPVAPVPAPTGAPVVDPTDAPVEAPVAPPVEPPTELPVEAPVASTDSTFAPAAESSAVQSGLLISFLTLFVVFA